MRLGSKTLRLVDEAEMRMLVKKCRNTAARRPGVSRDQPNRAACPTGTPSSTGVDCASSRAMVRSATCASNDSAAMCREQCWASRLLLEVQA